MELKVISTGSKGNAYIIGNDTEALLIECGVSFKKVKEALNFNLKKVQGCILTHEHNDHAAFIQDYAKFGIDIYSTQGTFSNFKSNHRFNIINNSQQFKIGNFTILSFPVHHDVKDPIGFVIYHKEIGKVLFCTDTYYIDYVFDDISTFIIEANFSQETMNCSNMYLERRILKSHMSLETCINTINSYDKSKANQVILIHLSNKNSDGEYFKNSVEQQTGIKTEIAFNNKNYELRRSN